MFWHSGQNSWRSFLTRVMLPYFVAKTCSDAYKYLRTSLNTYAVVTIQLKHIHKIAILLYWLIITRTRRKRLAKHITIFIVFISGRTALSFTTGTRQDNIKPKISDKYQYIWANVCSSCFKVSKLNRKRKLWEAGLLRTHGIIYDGLQKTLNVDCWMAFINSDFNLIFDTSSKSETSLTVQECH